MKKKPKNKKQHLWIERICKYCGETFEVRKKRIKENRGIFCSKECLGKWQSENIRGKSHPNWMGGMPIWTCGVCGKEFKRHRNKKHPPRFCSFQCRGISDEWMSTRRGKEHHNWCGGKSFEPYGIKFDTELREKIRRRDNHICQLCGKRQHESGRIFCVHHIDYNKTNNREDNLTTLCINCHIQTNYNRQWWIDYFLEV